MASTERTPILPAASRRPAAAHPQRRLAGLAVGVVALVTLVVVVLNVALNFDEVATSPSGSVAKMVFPADANGTRQLLPFCEEHFFTQQLNHFTRANGTFEQRYFVCGKQFSQGKPNGSLFFYTGNEDDVLLYLNHTGLMWENAEEFRAVMVFAEHRYFGKSIPFKNDRELLDNMEFLSSSQALADFAVLLEFLKGKDQFGDVPVIGFGGSYGGMLSAWFRLKYPQFMDGVIAASAPVLNFLDDPEHPLDSEAFQRIVTFDMTPAAGSSENCVVNTRKAIAALLRLSETPEGRNTIAQVLNMCNPHDITSPLDAQALVYSTIGAFGTLAMGNYPYPSSYMTAPGAMLPAYPVRAACEFLSPNFTDGDDVGVLGALRDAVGILYNATGAVECYFPSSTPSDTNQTTVNLADFWGYLECSELYMPMSSDGVHDTFPPHLANETEDDADCMATWGVHLRPDWAVTEYGGLKALRASSNIVFSNGNYDPWSGTGVLTNLSESVVALPIDGGAHHVDLFFSHPQDPPALKQAREAEKCFIAQWIREFYERKAKQ